MEGFEMEHTIIVRTRDCYPAPRFVAETDYSLRMSRGSVGTGHSFWAAVADAIREAHTDLFGRYDASDWQN